jgi:hypothetical protein
MAQAREKSRIVTRTPDITAVCFAAASAYADLGLDPARKHEIIYLSSRLGCNNEEVDIQLHDVVDHSRNSRALAR